MRKKFLVFMLLVVFAVFFGVQAARFVFKPRMPVVLTQQQQLSPGVEPILAKWIYEHSDRISMADCKQIARVSIKEGKALLLIAVMSAESEFVRSATSNKNAVGLTQVMWSVWGPTLQKVGIASEKRDLYDIEPSIRAGSYVLNECLRQTAGDLPRALERYLGGRSDGYVTKILKNLADLYLKTEGK